MRLNKEQLEKLVSKLASYNHKIKCDVCGGDKWTVSNTVFELREFNGGNMIIGGNSSVYPVIPLSCNTCGNTKLLNAITNGVMNPQGNTEKKEDNVR